MSIIYAPKGKAQEYAASAVNLYRGCEHNCSYCYAPRILRMTPERFRESVPRPGVIEKLKHEAERWHRRNFGRVLLSFTSDPYQPIERQCRLARQAVTLLGENGYPISILTKSLLARDDFHLFRKYNVEFGMTIHLTNDRDQSSWEPGLPSAQERFDLLADAKAQGIKTWVSVEPVIDPNQAIAVVRRLIDDQLADRIMVGKLNHNPELEQLIDWGLFGFRIMRLLTDAGPQSYYIKTDLWKQLSATARMVYCQRREVRR